MRDADLANAVDVNYWDAFRLMADASGGETLEQDGVIAVATGAPLAALNVAFVTGKLPGPKAALAQAADFFDTRRLPFIVRIREGTDPGSEEAAAALGMPYRDAVPGMALHPMPAAPRPATDLEIRTVEDIETLSVFQRVFAEGFGMPRPVPEEGPGGLDRAGRHRVVRRFNRRCGRGHLHPGLDPTHGRSLQRDDSRGVPSTGHW